MKKTGDAFQARLEKIVTNYARLSELQSSFLPDDSGKSGAHPVWAWETDSHGNLNWCSPEVTHLTGYKPSELTGIPAFTLILTEISASMLQKAFESKQTIRNLVLEGFSRDGREIHLAFHAEPGQMDPSRNTGYRGLTNVLQMELPKDSPSGKTTPSYEKTTSADASLLSTYRASGGFSVSKEGFNSTLSSPADRIQSSEIRETKLLVPIQIGGTTLGILELERGEEHPAWAESDIRVVENLANQLGSAIQDARADDLMLQALEEMQQADQLKSQLLANMSHELRTPLNSIIGFSSVILKGIDGPVNETQEQDIQQIYNAGQHLLGLINNVLDLSKIEADKMELALSRVNLQAIIHEVVEITTALIKQKPVELIVDIPENIPVIEADSTRVRQILLNLLSNAVKFTDEGHIAIFVRTYAGSKGEEILIAVADTGIGIAPEDQIKLFEPFSQIQGMSSRPGMGTGLGLSICRHLVDLHQGRIWVESSPGEGSTFTFTLPTRQSSEPTEFRIAEIRFITGKPEKAAVLQELLPKYTFHPSSLEELQNEPSGFKPESPPLLVELPTADQELWLYLQIFSTSPLYQGFPVQFLAFDNNQGIILPPLRFMPLPVTEKTAMHLIQTLIKNPAKNEKPIWFLVNTDKDFSAAQASLLSDTGQIEVETFNDAREALTEIRTREPAVVLFNLFMPQAEGFRILETIRAEQLLPNSECVLMLPDTPAGHEGRQFMRYIQHLASNNKLTLQAIQGLIQQSITKYSNL
ncbi:MAG: hypothetical protein JXA25_10285 [Anaerolineales bacterium]|nr:hypothetical protein [Anaerolineales bacterium]